MKAEIEKLRELLKKIDKGNLPWDSHGELVLMVDGEWACDCGESMTEEDTQPDRRAALIAAAVNALAGLLDDIELLRNALRQIEELTWGGKGETAAHIIATAALKGESIGAENPPHES